MSDDSKARVRWALNQIARLQVQQDTIAEQIRRHHDFIAMLEASDAAIASAPATKRAKAPRRNSPLADFLRAAVAEAGPAGLDVAEIADRVQKLGFKAAGKTPLRIRVSAELVRQSKKPKARIFKVGTGRYASSPSQVQTVLATITQGVVTGA